MMNMPRYEGVSKQTVPAWNNTKYAAVRGQAFYDCVIMNYFDCLLPMYMTRSSIDYFFSESLRMVHNSLKEQ